MESEDISFSDIVPHEYPGQFDGTEESIENQENLGEEEVNHMSATAQESNVQAPTETSPTKKTRRLKSEVKKVSSKWILFSTETRPKVMAEFPQYGFAEVAREIAERYRNISAHDSERFDDLVAMDKERYKRELAEAEEDAPIAEHVGNQSALAPSLAFPLSKVRKACKLDPEVRAINKDAAILITKAVELFVGFIARKSAYTVSLRGVRSIREQDLIQTIFMNEPLEFLRIDFPKKALLSASSASSNGASNSHKSLHSSSSSSSAATHGITPKHRMVGAPKSTSSGKRSGKSETEAAAPSGKSIALFFGGGSGGGSGSGKKRAVDEAAENDPSHEEDGEEEIDEAEPEPENHEVEQEEGKELGAQTEASIRHSKSAEDSVDDIAGDESAEEAAEVKE